MHPVIDALTVPAAYLLGAVPFSQIVSLGVVGTDLRGVGSGTVSGTGLYRVGGVGAVILGGGLDVAKGALAAAWAGGNDIRAVLVSAAVVIGHCWSVFLRGAGGRGISPAMGALAVLYWPAAALLLAGLAVGRLLHETGFVVFLAALLVIGALAVAKGGFGLALALAVVVPMLLKRLLGNNLPQPGGGLRVYRARLLFDADQHHAR